MALRLKRLTKKQKKVLFRGALAGFALFAVAIVLIAENKFSGMVLGGLGEQFSTHVYSSPLILDLNSPSRIPGLKFRFLNRIDRLGYQSSDNLPENPGETRVDGDKIEIFLRGFSAPFYSQPAQLVFIRFYDDHLELTDPSGLTLSEVAIEPVLIDELSGTKNIRREPATWEEIPVRLADAVVAVEDGTFYKHWGVSPRAIARAIWRNLSGRGGLQGGSTITQQLAKNLFLSSKRTFRRKLTELFFALYLEIRFSKEKILTMYLNHIYMGQDGPVSIAGVKAASRFYFEKELSELSIAECAFLAGVIRSPYRYNPARDRKAALERTHHVLDRMKFHGLLNEQETKIAQRLPLVFRPPSSLSPSFKDASFFVAEVVRQLTTKYAEEEIYRLGFRIYTTMDPELQHAAQTIIKKARPQGALVAMDPHTGDVVALVGGRSFGESQFNRATQARRQPGSAFKPFIYGAALENGYTPASLLEDKPRLFNDGKGGHWKPENYDKVYRNIVPLRQALAESLNSATVDLVSKISPAKAVEFAGRMGISSPIEKSLAVGLGASEVSLLELTAAYAPFSNGGFRVQPRIIQAVSDAEGGTLDVMGIERTSVIDPSLASLITSLLQSTVSDGTAKHLPQLGWPYASAGKTGTTNDGRDAWFIGYTPELLAGVWVGSDIGKQISVAGGRNALPHWASFFVSAYQGSKPKEFEPAQGVVKLKIDPLNGLIAQSGCPEKKLEVFMEGTQPTKPCPIHAGGVKGWFQRLFGR